MAAAGAVAAVVAKRRRERPAAAKWTAADQKRYDMMRMELEKRQQLSVIFQRYDVNQSNKLERDQVKNLLTDMDASTPVGTPPSDAELDFIIKVSDRSDDGCIARKEFELALTAWDTYTKMRSKLESTMSKYDTSGSGKLEKDELQKYLTDLNGGKEVPEEEVDWVLEEADIFGDGAIRQQELVMATSAWYIHVEEEEQKAQSSSCCTIT